MLLERKTLAFVAPSGEKYLICKTIPQSACLNDCYFTCHKLSKFSKTCFTTTKETALAPFNLAYPVETEAEDGRGRKRTMRKKI